MSSEGENELHWQTEIHANPKILSNEITKNVLKSQRVNMWNDYYFQSWFSFGNNNGRRIKLDKQGYSTTIDDDFFKPLTAENVACTVHYHFESKKSKTEAKKLAEEEDEAPGTAKAPTGRRLAMNMENMCMNKKDTECMHRNLDENTKDN